MKIIICYPPLSSAKGAATLGQNRQFQYFKEPTYIYPVVPAQAATMLKLAGHEVVWKDCLAENLSYEDFLKFVQTEKADLIALETKTPVVKQHWKIIDDLKKRARERGVDVIDFGMGSPDQPTPKHVVDKLCEAAKAEVNINICSHRKAVVPIHFVIIVLNEAIDRMT